MSAPATDQAATPTVRSSMPPAAPANRAARRHGSASRQVGAAGQTRRTLQRDLARREASLRISRRVSGPAGGVTRPPLADAAPIAPVPVAPAPAPFVAPTTAAPIARSAAPAPAPAPARVPAGADLRPAPAGLEVPAFVGSTKPRRAPRAAAPAPQGPKQQARPVAVAATAVAQPRMAAVAAPAPLVRHSPLASAASALAAAPARLPVSLPQRPRLTVLPGGLVESAATGRRRVSTPAVMVAAVMMVILTFGAILGLQISKTQVNAQMGADLSAISTLQQKVTATREQLNRASASANVDGAARKGGMIEPDLTDVNFTSVGNRAESAERAKRLLSKAPVAPTAAQRAAAEAKAKQAAATAAATGESMAPVTPDAAQTPAPPTGSTTAAATGTGAIQ